MSVSIRLRGLHPSGHVVAQAQLQKILKFQSPFEDYVLPDSKGLLKRRRVKGGFQSPFEDYVLPNLQVRLRSKHSGDSIPLRGLRTSGQYHKFP